MSQLPRGSANITRRHYTDGEIETIERAAERRGREAATAHERTIEPAGGEMPQTAVNELSATSHAGLALYVGDLRERVAQLEQIVAGLAPPERPAHVEHEPTPIEPVDGEHEHTAVDAAVDREGL